ncbi:MAG: LysM peptidoglycan-binding domain-containing protein, partial [Planctomycetota bacterium]
MTSDAKIGLLLGLIFIFVIAFIINGLPSFRGGIGSKEIEIIDGSRQVRPRGAEQVPIPPEDREDIRHAMQMPEPPAEASRTEEVEAAPVSRPPPAVEKIEKPVMEAGKSDLPRVYVVGEGENLSVIAKKFYGTEEGNKIANVARIFRANRELLKSPDEVYAGQRILIPPLQDSEQNKNLIDKLLGNPVFEAVESIGKRHANERSHKLKASGGYVVKENDNLWRIAEEQLGDGSRYREIAKLNRGVLEDENLVT